VLLRSLRAAGLVYVGCAVFAHGPDRADAQTRPDSLTLQQPANVSVVPVMNENRTWFVNYIFWDDVPDSIAAFIHPPDTAGWNAPTSATDQDSLAVLSTSGSYLGSIDRTVGFRALEGGRVGVTSRIRLRYEIIAEERFNNIINVGAGYVAGDPIPCTFIDETSGATFDLGFNLHLSEGLVDSNGVFVLGLEDFEGYHIWRGVTANGSDLTVIGELSKEEEFMGAPIDVLYFNAILPALRTTGVFEFPFNVPGLGDRLDITDVHPNGVLGPNEMAWFDSNAFNGFTYRYTVTSFDRDYSVSSHRQGLVKFDNCMVEQGIPYECASELLTVPTLVTSQNDLQRVYAVPNPYRSGTSQFSTPNYHNFPDNKVRFVNVPAACTLRIYTVAGDLVYEIRHTSGLGNIEWDTNNTSGEPVASGSYIYRLQTTDGDGVYGRIIVIR